MRYKDIFIPLMVGLVFIFGRGRLLKPQDPAYQRKNRSLKIGGYILLAIAVLYTFLVFRNNKCITC
jgi:hypothetical protein